MTDNAYDSAYYRFSAEKVRATLPGEVIRRAVSGTHGDTNTTTRSTGNDKFTINGGSWMIENPTLEDIAAMIDGLFAPGNYFAALKMKILDAANADACLYVQTALEDDDEQPESAGKYVIEAQFAHGLDKGLDSPNITRTQHRRYTNDIGDVKEIFKAFASGAAPDVTGWKDVSEESFVR